MAAPGTVDLGSVPVAIVGGGPVGLGLAIELGQRGIECVVIEPYEAPQPIPKGQNLTQRSLEHFHFWGVEAQLRAARTIPAAYGIGGLTAYGTLLGPYAYDWLQRELVRPYYFCDNERLPQYATEAVLRNRIAQLPSVTVRYGSRANEVEPSDDGVALTLTDLQGQQSLLRAQYVVGCDGSRSLVRQQANITQTLSDHDRLMVLLVFRSRGLHELLKRYPGKSYYNVLQPELQGYWKFFGRVDLGNTWFFHAPVPAGTTRDNFDFQHYVQETVGAPIDIEFDYIGFWSLRFAIADRYRCGRIFVAGDAAHSHPPYGGYGINTGFEDARNLGWKLAASLQGWGSDGLLDSYDAERRPVFASTANDFIARSIETDRTFLRDFSPDSDRSAFEAAWALRSQGAVSEVNAFEPNYEGSTVVFGPIDGRCSAVGRHSFEARAGHHLAPARMPSGDDVFEHLDDGFTLLAWDADRATVNEFVEAARAERVPLHVVQDQRSGEVLRYGASVILVRPDQYVAWAGEHSQIGARKILQTAIGRS